MNHVLVLQHFPCETLGTIADALHDRGITAQYVRTFEGQPVPREMGTAAGLIVMGGPMGVYEQAQYPFLREERRLLEAALHDEKPVLGVCLGSQLLAAALGAQVTKGKQKELGWHDVRLAAAAAEDRLWAAVRSPFTAYHWHGDVFDLPQGAVALASSDLTEHQAFRYGRNAYGLLFHLEVTAQMVREMAGAFADEAREAGVDPVAIMRQAGTYLTPLHAIGAAVFGRWAGLVGSRVTTEGTENTEKKPGNDWGA